MNTTQAPVLLGKEDFRLLKLLSESFSSRTAPTEMTLSHELSRATVVEDDRVPSTCIRLSSRVKIKEIASNREMEFQIVLPASADIQNKRVSVLTPMGAALIGLSKGEKVAWKMPGGMKHFEILDVTYQP